MTSPTLEWVSLPAMSLTPTWWRLLRREMRSIMRSFPCVMLGTNGLSLFYSSRPSFAASHISCGSHGREENFLFWFRTWMRTPWTLSLRQPRREDLLLSSMSSGTWEPTTCMSTSSSFVSSFLVDSSPHQPYMALRFCLQLVWTWTWTVWTWTCKVWTWTVWTWRKGWTWRPSVPSTNMELQEQFRTMMVGAFSQSTSSQKRSMPSFRFGFLLSPSGHVQTSAWDWSPFSSSELLLFGLSLVNVCLG